MGSKRGPLSKAEVFYVEQHAKLGKNLSDIALDLDRPAKSIEKCFTKAQKEVDSKALIAGDQFAKQSGAVIMTQNASTLSDARRKISSAKSKNKDCITKIRKD